MTRWLPVCSSVAMVMAALVAGGTFVAGGGCRGTSSPGDAVGTQSVDASGARPDRAHAGPPTYWEDVAPILYARCVSCHQPDGIGPFRLDTYADTRTRAHAVAEDVMAGLMPPYLVTHDGTCGDFQASETLSADEKQVLWDWAMGEQAEGPAITLALPPRPALPGAQTFATPLFTPVAAGGALAVSDEYRCFPLDSGLKKTSFITGYEVNPGTPALIHHAIVYVVDPTAPSNSTGRSNDEVMRALDDESPDRAGWPCFGSAGAGVRVDAVPVTWAPGGGPLEYPAGTGVRLHASDKLVVQIHYNLAGVAGPPPADSTLIKLRFADNVERRLAFLLPDPFLESLSKTTPDQLPPGQAAARYSWERSFSQLGLSPLTYVDILGVMPHMHQRGVTQELWLRPGSGGAPACQMRVPRWDFDWQRAYFYRQPLRLSSGGGVQVTCTYDTSSDSAPVSPGWGTQNEMCLTVLVLALPPGV